MYPAVVHSEQTRPFMVHHVTHCTPSVRNEIAINAAFFDEIKRDNVRLRMLITSVSSQVVLTEQHQIKTMAELLERLRGELSLHFSLEEAYGYFRDPAEVDPDYSSRAQFLCAEHMSMYATLCSITLQAEQLCNISATTNDFRDLTQRIDSFLSQLSRHESQENELIQRSFNDDLGAGD